MAGVFLDAFIDSLKVLAVLVVVNFLIAFLEPKVAGKINLKGKLAPLVGVGVGLLPQCGFSVVATDLYKKRHITIGTLLGVYLATSDEALPIFLANPSGALDILPIMAIKFVIGLLVGYAADAVCAKNVRRVERHNEECRHEPEVHIGCCGHSIENEEQLNGDEPQKPQIDAGAEQRKEKLRQFLWHPLEHSLKIFIYILVINVIFGIIVYYVGEHRLLQFLSANKYVAPLFAVIVGAVPNCASSVVISNLYLMGGLGFGAAVGGLCMNAGLGFAVLFKGGNKKEALAIFAVMFAVSVALSYLISLCFKFEPLLLLR